MKNSTATIIIVVLVVVGIFAFVWSRNDKDAPSTEIPGGEKVTTIKGCYVARNGKDVYTLNVENENPGSASGTISFKNFEKDSSVGAFNGTYYGEILVGDYAFLSEGTSSVTQVIFKKSGDDFVRGMGPVNSQGDRFTNLNDITFDASSKLFLFKKETCDKNSLTKITTPKGGENLTAGKKLTLVWSGGSDPIHIFLVDTSLKSTGVSASIVDSVFSIKNNGTYEYTLPLNLKTGTYEFQIGTNTSNTFTINAKK